MLNQLNQSNLVRNEKKNLNTYSNTTVSDAKMAILSNFIWSIQRYILNNIALASIKSQSQLYLHGGDLGHPNHVYGLIQSCELLSLDSPIKPDWITNPFLHLLTQAAGVPLYGPIGPDLLNSPETVKQSSLKTPSALLTNCYIVVFAIQTWR